MDAILKRDDTELAFVWNRNPSAVLGTTAEKYLLEDLSLFAERYRIENIYGYMESFNCH